MAANAVAKLRASMSEAKADEATKAIAEAFPDVDPGGEPAMGNVLVQFRRPKAKTAGGIILAAETRDAEKWNTQVAKVIAIGPVAFRDKRTLEPWPEGNACNPGDFVRVPLYGGDRWEVPVPGEEPALFGIFKDIQIGVRLTGDPLKIKAFI